MADPWAQFKDAPAQTSDPWAQFKDASTSAAPVSQPEPKTDWLRQVALHARAAAEGVINTLALPQDMQTSLQNKIVDAVLSHTGASQMDRMAVQQPTISGQFAQFLDKAGAYNPSTPNEQLGTAVTRGVTGGLTSAGLGGISTTGNVIRAGISGGTGAAAAEGTRQAGYGPGAQFAAGLLGGLAPGMVENTARLAWRTGANALRPFTRAGQEGMAADVLAAQADNPQAAAQNLQNAAPVIPGSARTTGEASQDIGLVALEKGVRGKDPAAFGQRLSEQNAARQAELTALGGTPADISNAKLSRDSITGPMRQQALSSGGVADPAPIHATIDQILASPVGQRETVSKTMQWAKGLIGDQTDPASLYEIRKDLQLAQAGKLQPSSANAPAASTLASARGQLGDVVSSLDDAIEQAAPGFKAYLARYRDLSKPIDQMKVIQEIQRRSQLVSADVTTGQNFIGNASFSRALDSAIQKNGSKLTPDQIDRLNAIRTDLQYGQAVNSPLVKAPGSDTFQNFSIAQAIGAGASDVHPIFRLVTKPLQWIYKAAGSDARVNEILTDAMLDPKLAAQMLKQATAQNVQSFSSQLKARLAASSAGAVGAMSSRGSPPLAAQSSPAQ